MKRNQYCKLLLIFFVASVALTTQVEAAIAPAKSKVSSLPKMKSKKTNDLIQMIQSVGQLAGGLDHFYYEDIPNEKTTRRLADALWKCYSTTGGLPDKADHDGVLIDGGACPIRYVRGVSKDNKNGFVEYKVLDASILEIIAIENYKSDMKFSHTSSAAGDIHEMFSESEFSFTNNHGKLYLKLNHSLFVSADQKKSERRTDYHFTTGSQSALTLSYQVLSEGGGAQKSCFVGRNKIDCKEWRGYYGYLESLAGW